MHVVNLIQSQIIVAKENSNILVATRLLRPLIRSPVAQLIFSFVVGYYATTKITQLYVLIRKQVEKKSADLDSAGGSTSIEPKSILIEENKSLQLTPRQLTAYNGVHGNQPIYTALNGKIYDLSSAPDTFSRKGKGLYSLLAGCDANQVLNIACGSMGVSTNDIIQRWEQSLNAEFNIIGFLVDSDISESESESEESDDDSTVVGYSNDLQESAN